MSAERRHTGIDLTSTSKRGRKFQEKCRSFERKFINSC